MIICTNVFNDLYCFSGERCGPTCFKSIEYSNSMYLTDDWSPFQSYTFNHGHRQAHVTGVLLDPGRLYRFVVKLCAGETCYRPVHSNGVLILANPPTTGDLDVQHDNTTVPEKVNITCKQRS